VKPSDDREPAPAGHEASALARSAPAAVEVDVRLDATADRILVDRIQIQQVLST
jgi:hypothetical protein